MKAYHLTESEMPQSVAIIFGRFNPPHKGHKHAWETAAQHADQWYVGTNKSTIGPDDPLPFEVKIEAMKAIMPEVEDHLVAEQSWWTLAAYVFKKYGGVPGRTLPFDLVVITDEPYVVPGLLKSNGQVSNHGEYSFQNIRLPFENIEQAKKHLRISSATALRNAVANGDREGFANAAGVDADTPVAGHKFFDLVAHYLLPHREAQAAKDAAKAEKEKLKAQKLAAKAQPAVKGPAQELAESGICWKGYKRKPGTKKYAQGSCEKIEEKSVSTKQARFMAAAAHDAGFANHAGIKQSVAKEFNKADTGTKQLSKAMKQKPKKRLSEELAEGTVHQFPKKHKGDLSDTHDCPKCGGDLQGGKYMGHEVKVCMPCKQVYLPPNSGIDQKGNKIVDEIAGAFPSPSTRAKWAADAAASNAAEAKRQEALKAQQLIKNTAEVDRLQKVNHHSLDSTPVAPTPVVPEVAMRMQGSSQSEKDANARAKALEAEAIAKHQAIVKAYVDIMSKGQPLPPKMQQSYNTMPEFKKEVDAALAKIPGRPGEIDLLQRQNHHLIPKNESKSDALANTAKRLTDPSDGKTAKLRAAGDKRREEQLKSRDVAKKNDGHKRLSEALNDIYESRHGSIQADVADALPATFVIPKLQNQDAYHQYRFGLAVAAARGEKGRKQEHGEQFAGTSPWGENEIVVTFDPSEIETIDAALKLVGLNSGDKRALNSKDSIETPDVAKKSPVANIKRNKYGI